MPGDSAAGFLPVSGGTFMEQSFWQTFFKHPPCWKVGQDFLTVKQVEMQEKFTPGEWDSDPNFSDDIFDEEGYCIAGIYGRGTTEERLANMLLIRAAPDLYYALKNLLPHVEALMPHNGEYGERVAADIQAAHDAIEKALGL